MKLRITIAQYSARSYRNSHKIDVEASRNSNNDTRGYHYTASEENAYSKSLGIFTFFTYNFFNYETPDTFVVTKKYLAIK